MKFGDIHFLRRFAPSYGPHYGVAAQGCMRGMGILYVVSFWSLAAQIVGLSGPGGLLPSASILSAVAEVKGIWSPLFLPSLAWLSTHPLMLLGCTAMGAIAGLCLLYGFFPWISALMSWICWVSLIQICQPWMSGAGDLLTTEMGFLILFLLPPLSRFYPSPSKMGSHVTGIILLNGLLFKVLFSSGLAKLNLGDPAWGDATAFYHFFETQSLPTIAGWYVHHFPGTVLKYGLWGMMFIEIILPFYIFLPRTFRNILSGAVVIESIILLLTGNHGFYPLLLLILAFSLVDDVAWRKVLPGTCGPSAAISYYQPKALSLIFLVTFLPIYIWQIYTDKAEEMLPPWKNVAQVFGSIHAINPYAMFTEVPHHRKEISIQGSVDGRQWVEYRFRLKPTDPKSLPMMSVLHQPRLDEAFVALASKMDEDRQVPPPVWLYRLIHNLMINDPATLALFPVNPFPKTPPRFIRLAVYEYTFADPVTHRNEQLWWEREFTGFYGPIFSREKLDSHAQLTPPESPQE
ncbi:lipase maturation factor family protein [Kiritimatiellaeota bacterium B1221]|nr:lipase maturation factor family protein [Kiritimatiellaeota bacterium B1221]